MSAAPKTQQVNFRLPWEVYQRLEAATRAFRRSQADIVVEGLKLYFNQLSVENRQLVDRLIVPRRRS